MNDFMLDTMEIIIAPGNLPIIMGNYLLVTAIDDNLVEGDNEFDINFTSTSNDQQIDIVDPSVNTVTITDNDGMYINNIAVNIFQFTIAGVIQIEFLENTLTVKEGVNITIDIFVAIIVPAGKQLGCDIDVVFNAQSGGIASEYNNDVYSTEDVH